MAGDRMTRILGLLRSADGSAPTAARLCDVSVELTGATGAGIMLMTDDVQLGALGATDEVSATIEELQFALGEGPCLDAYFGRRPVSEPDLVAPEQLRWPAFTPAAVEAGARAIFGFPLQVGVTRLGALDLYRDTPGPMSDEAHADATVMADVAARALIDMQAHAPAGSLSKAMVDGSNLQLAVHQASGMVSVQLGIPVGDALARLRAFAFADGRALEEVAADVVGRRLRLDDSPGGADVG
jgi:hypothetical protein